MKNILVTTMALFVGLFWTVSAQAQMPTWNAEQSEVWAYVEQSWVDDVAENGRWPADYTHANAIGCQCRVSRRSALSRKQRVCLPPVEQCVSRYSDNP